MCLGMVDADTTLSREKQKACVLSSYIWSPAESPMGKERPSWTSLIATLHISPWTVLPHSLGLFHLFLGDITGETEDSGMLMASEIACAQP